MVTLLIEILAKIYSIVKVCNFVDLPKKKNLEHSMCILLEILEKMCTLLEYYKTNQINAVQCFSSIPSNQSQY